MKECPVCNAVTFDDMETCYECLHRFDEEKDEDQKPYEQMKEALDASRLLRQKTEEQQETQNKALQSTSDKEKRGQEQTPQQATSDVKPWPTEAIMWADDAAESNKKESETWALKLRIPAHCKEVTLCLERAEKYEAQESYKTPEPCATYNLLETLQRSSRNEAVNNATEVVS